MKRPLNSDELGELGEQHFPRMCVEERLICNKSSRDRAGWDFIVEFPFGPTSYELPLDSRPQPPSCRAQVKTVWEGAGHIRLRLSSAERLAKLLEPAAIFVLTVDNDMQFHAIHCIHVIDEVLEEILKQSRICQRNGGQINKSYVRLRYDRLAVGRSPKGSEVKRFIESIQDSNRKEYVAGKDHQIKNLGVIGNRYGGKFTLEVGSSREVEDVILGLKPGRFSSFSIDETRWGITLPWRREDAGQLSVQPRARKGRVVFRGKSPGETVRMDVGIVVPPRALASADNVRIRLFNELAEFTLERDSDGFRFRSDVPPDKTLTLTDQIKLNTMQVIMSGGSGVLDFFDGNKRIFGAEFQTDTIVDAEGLRFGKEVLEKLQAILKTTGADSIGLTIDHLNSQIGIIDMIHEIISNPGQILISPITICPTAEFPAELHQVETLIMGRIHFSGSAIAFCAIAPVDISGSDELKTLTVGTIALRQIDLIGDSEEEYEQFNRNMQDEAALQMVLKLGNYEGGVRRENDSLIPSAETS